MLRWTEEDLKEDRGKKIWPNYEGLLRILTWKCFTFFGRVPVLKFYQFFYKFSVELL